MILSGARVALGPEEAAALELEVRGGRIRRIGPRLPGSPRLRLDGYLVLPGLINAHDHLEFNLFPRLGRGPHPNAGVWARAIYRPEESPVREHLQVPQGVRLWWGGLKNLLSGVTTVAHHNPTEAATFRRNFPVRVVRRLGWAHSLEFSPDLEARFQRTPAGWPFLLHLGEATDGGGVRELRRLEEMGALDGRTVLVHAVDLGAGALRKVRQAGAAVVWCPSSNLFTLGRTAGRELFRSGVAVALGTDSGLTGAGDLLDEVREARRAAGLALPDLYRMATTEAARILRLDRGEGRIVAGGVADLAVVPDRRRTPAASLRPPELVLLAGRVKLASPHLARRLPAALRAGLERLEVARRPAVLVAADVPALYRRAARELGASFALAGKRVRACT